MQIGIYDFDALFSSTKEKKKKRENITYYSTATNKKIQCWLKLKAMQKARRKKKNKQLKKAYRKEQKFLSI